MQKKYLAGLSCLALSLTLLLAACGSADSGGSSGSTQPSSTPESSDTETPPASSTEETLFTPGTWLSDGGQYYFFDEGGATGRTASLDSGTGVGFAYTLNGDQADFSMGGADDSSPCTVRRDGDTITLEWEDGTTETLTYASEQGSDSFLFYSNQELADMALTHYKTLNSDQENENLAAAAQTNDDGSVTIQVYENLGDHNSTAAWYTVDRLTGTGTDDTGAEVDLTSGQ